MADDVGVPAASVNLREVEANGDSSRVGIRNIIRDFGNSCRVGEANPDRGAGSIEMLCLRELGCLC